ncbi:hypothetical protein [Bradyrhizobium sp. AZCC 2230]|uniref:hypothetical protein n=1 Tax=Bradyrhizobium sp. AZCC 2230 TaxID=3117021 RepID=UPI002FF18BBC
MQIRSKAYLQMISHLRGLRALLSWTDDPATKEPSLMLIFVAVLLALLLAILEVDQHSAALQSLGLLGDPPGTQPNFTGP